MPKMKKKMFAVLAGVMVLMLGSVAVMAAGSTDSGKDTTVSEDLAKVVEGATLDNGTAVTVTPLETAVVEEGQVKASETLQSAGVNVEGKKITTVAAVDVARPAGVTDEELEAGVAVTFKVTGIVSGKTYAVLHQKADGTWEKLQAEVKADGSITAIFHSFSPVLVVEIEDQAATATSPKTGEF